jgi:hypothetical protein
MQENHLFEYAVIRVMPHVEREEFLNVGIILFCPNQKFLRARFEIDDARIRMLCTKIDMTELREYIRSFERICSGGKDAGAIGMLSIAERFRWLTAARSTTLQTSKVHPGLCKDAGEMLDHLYGNLVEKSDA